MLNNQNIQLNLFFKFILFLCVFFFDSCTDRQKVTGPSDVNNNYYTEIGGKIFGQLTVSNSPYLVTDEIIVDSSQVLLIEPGVIVHFTDSSDLLIKGELIAMGTKDKAILFSAQNDEWKGIKFSDTDQNSIIQFAIVEKVVLSYQDSTDFGAIQINNSNVTIKNCIIRDNEAANGAGITVIESDVLISNNIFRGNYALVHGAGLLLYQSNSSIINNTFYDNYCVNCGSAISILLPINDLILNNIIYKNLSQATCSQFYYNAQDSSNLTIAYNFISDNDPDPKFISENDLRLSFNSTCIDSGNPDSKYNDVDGTRNDLGAFGGPDGDW